MYRYIAFECRVVERAMIRVWRGWAWACRRVQRVVAFGVGGLFGRPMSEPMLGDRSEWLDRG